MDQARSGQGLGGLGQGGLASRYETVIGLEIHAQLPTASKLFCGCSTHFGGEANTNICPVCLGLPGSLPVINGQAVLHAVRAALALGLTIHETSIFARKNYFYPDLPKGYQISQFAEPYSEHGVLEFEVDGETKRAGITRIHMEEDAGKNVHGVSGDSAVDLNRAGTPLIEIVGEPDLRSSSEAVAYMRAVREILLFIGVNDGNMEEGSFRCDANVSIRPHGQKAFGQRVELKNINSFRFVQKAIDVEVARQAAIVDGGGVVKQETRGFDADKGRTYSLRSKEDAHDYRYFPDPDLPPLVLPPALVEAERRALSELPGAARKRLVAQGIAESSAQTVTAHPAIVRFVDDVARLAPSVPLKKVVNFVQTEILRGLHTHGLEARFTVSSAQVAELLELGEGGKISGKQTKEVLSAIEGTAQSPAAWVAEHGMAVVSDHGALERQLRDLMAQNPKQLEGLKAGKKQLAGFFVGQIMKATGGSADPKLVTDLLEKLLAES